MNRNRKDKHLSILVSCDPVVELLNEIQTLHKAFLLDKQRVRKANKTLEESKDTREEAENKLSMCNSSRDLGPLEKVKELRVVDLNRKVGINQNCRVTSTETQILTWSVI